MRRHQDEVIARHLNAADACAAGVATHRIPSARFAVLLDGLYGSVSVDAVLHGAALARYRAALRSGTSFVDQVSLAVIARERVDAVFALDDDLAAAGVRLVPHSD